MIQLINLAKQYDINIEDNMIILERTITDKGKSICRINGKLVTLTILREFGRNLVDIHSQHDTYQLMSSHAHINLLDAFNSDDILKIDRKSTRLNSSHVAISYAVFCLKQKKCREI